MPRGKPRDLETRSSKERASMDMNDSLLHVTPRKGYMCRWIAISVNGQPHMVRQTKAFQQGWRPAKISDYPDFKGGITISDVMGGKIKQENDEFVTLPGLVLCEMPRVVYERLKEQERREAAASLDHVRKALNETAGGTDLPYESGGVIGDDSTGKNFL